MSHQTENTLVETVNNKDVNDIKHNESLISAIELPILKKYFKIFLII